MLEMYLRLHQARSVNNESCRGSSHSIGRDEVLNAGAMAAKNHPVGHWLILAESGDEKSLFDLIEWVKPQLPELYDEAISVAMGKPTSGQLRKLVYAHPRYQRERRRAAEITAKAKHLSAKGDGIKATELDVQASQVMTAAIIHCQMDIISHGHCPKCRGTGVTERKHESCPVCGGSGKIIPDYKSIQKKHGDDIYNAFIRLVDQLQFERSDWLRMFNRFVSAEKVA